MAGGFQSYSTTPGTNVSLNGISVAEGCPASGINDAIRQLAADGTSLWQTTPTWMGTSGGSANAYTLTPTVALAAYTTGQAFRFLSSFGNTATATLNISALGAKNIVRFDNTTLQQFDIPNGTLVDVVYDGTSFRLLTATSAAVTGFKNALINGDFRVSQRGTSFSSPASGSYTLDRWVIGYDGTGAFSVSQGDFGATVNGARYYINWNQSGALSGSTARNLHQRVEGVNALAGQTYTLSFTASCASGTVSVTPAYTQFFGTGGSPSANVTGSGSAIAVTTSGTRFSQSIAFPSIAAKTLGSTALTDYTQVTLGLPTTGTYNVSFWDVQLELGSVATAFERRHRAVENLMCQRYYQVLQPLSYGYGVATVAILGATSTACPMRGTPTLTDSSSSDINVSGAALSTASNQVTVSGTITANGSYVINHVVALSAEF